MFCTGAATVMVKTAAFCPYLCVTCDSQKKSHFLRETIHRLVFLCTYSALSLRYELNHYIHHVVEIKCIFKNVNIPTERLPDFVSKQSCVLFFFFV